MNRQLTLIDQAQDVYKRCTRFLRNRLEECLAGTPHKYDLDEQKEFWSNQERLKDYLTKLHATTSLRQRDVNHLWQCGFPLGLDDDYQQVLETLSQGDWGRSEQESVMVAFDRRQDEVDGILKRLRSESAERAPQPTGDTPRWDEESRKLFLGNEVIRTFRQKAINCWSILNAFEEDGWPQEIDIPSALEPKRNDPLNKRLHDTVYKLNQGLERIEFNVAASATRVGWKRRDVNAA